MRAGRLEKLFAVSEDQLARLVSRNKDGLHTELVSNVEDIHKELEKFQKSARTFLGGTADIKVSDHIPEEMVAEAAQLLQAASVHQDGLKATLEKLKVALK